MPGSAPGTPRAESGARRAVGVKRNHKLRITISQNCEFPTIQGAILMKKILVTVVLGVAVLAAAKDAAPRGQAASPQPSAQPAAQPAQGQAAATPAQAGTPAQGPIIKDPVEYNAYMSAINQKD